MNKQMSQTNLAQLLEYLLQNNKEDIDNHTLTAHFWVVGLKKRCTLSFQRLHPNWAIMANIDEISIDISNMQVVNEAKNYTWIRLDLNNLNLYRSVIIDHKTSKIDLSLVLGITFWKTGNNRSSQNNWLLFLTFGDICAIPISARQQWREKCQLITSNQTKQL